MMNEHTHILFGIDVLCCPMECSICVRAEIHWSWSWSWTVLATDDLRPWQSIWMPNLLERFRCLCNLENYVVSRLTSIFFVVELSLGRLLHFCSAKIPIIFITIFISLITGVALEAWLILTADHLLIWLILINAADDVLFPLRNWWFDCWLIEDRWNAQFPSGSRARLHLHDRTSFTSSAHPNNPNNHQQSHFRFNQHRSA